MVESQCAIVYEDTPAGKATVHFVGCASRKCARPDPDVEIPRYYSWRHLADAGWRSWTAECFYCPACAARIEEREANKARLEKR